MSSEISQTGRQDEQTPDPAPGITASGGPERTDAPKPEKPLADARRRLDRAEYAKKHNLPVLDTHPDIVIGMAAAGLPQTRITQALGVPPDVVRGAIESAAGTIAEIRDRLKTSKIKAMERVESRLWPRFEREADKADAKDIDALSRAALNLEKIQAQVSGEGQQVTVKGLSEAPNVDLKIMIAALLDGR